MVTNLQLVSGEGEPLRVEYQLENVGDVEVQPAGWVRVINREGEQAFISDIGQGRIAVPPNSVITGAVESNSGLAKGDYSIETALNYHGAATLELNTPLKVQEDIAPPEAPARPAATELEFKPSTGVSPLIWVLGGVVALAGIVGGAIVLARRR